LATVEGTFTAIGASDNFTPASQLRRGRFNVSLFGTFEADVVLERSFNGGTDWIPVASVDLSPVTLDTPISLACEETEASVVWRLRCTDYTSGTINYRMSR
jgi:hypothetical protein